MRKVVVAASALGLAFGSAFWATPARADWVVGIGNQAGSCVQFDWRGGTATYSGSGSGQFQVDVNNLTDNRIGGGSQADSWSIWVNDQKVVESNVIEQSQVSVSVSGDWIVTVQGIDVGFWAGWYGPQFCNPTFVADDAPVIVPDPVVTSDPTPEPTVPPIPTGDYRLDEGWGTHIVAPQGQVIASVTAWYGNPNDGSQGADWSEQYTHELAGLAEADLNSGNYFGDPVPGVYKVLIATVIFEPAPVVVEPVTEVVREPEPVVVTEPAREPDPEPVIVPVPAPEPMPEPLPEPEPVVVQPEPVVAPEPVPAPQPEPAPAPTPEPVPVEPTPDPAPVKPIPDPAPEPAPEPPVVQPDPEPVPPVEEPPVVTPDPVEVTPEPAPVVEPEPVPVEPIPVVPVVSPPSPPAPPVVEPQPAPPAPEPTKEEAMQELMAEAQADDVVVPEAIASIPLIGGAAVAVVDALNALGNVGADMTPEVRAAAKKEVVAAVIVTQVAQTASQVAAAAGGASAMRRKQD